MALNNAIRKLSRLLPDKLYLGLRYRMQIGKWINWKTPQGFNEKMQWLKLFDRNPLYPTIVDKIKVKSWVADRLGEEVVVPTLAIWDRVEDIDTSRLPEKFVLKTNHDCGGIVVCENRETFNLIEARKFLSKHLAENYYWECREWPYSQVVPRIYAEEYVDAGAGQELVDYKLMCFAGRCEYIFVCTGRKEGDLRVDFFDIEWDHLPFMRHYKNAPVIPTAPSNLREMIAAAEVLAQGFPFVRVDFYSLKDRLLFGEMTLYPGGGFEEFDPEEWDMRIGESIDLTKVDQQ